MKKFLLSDLFFGILLTLFVAGSYVTGSAILESLELKFYDIRAKLLQTPDQPPNEVAIVAISPASQKPYEKTLVSSPDPASPSSPKPVDPGGTLRIEPGGDS